MANKFSKAALKLLNSSSFPLNIGIIGIIGKEELNSFYLSPLMFLSSDLLELKGDLSVFCLFFLQSLKVMHRFLSALQLLQFCSIKDKDFPNQF